MKINKRLATSRFCKNCVKWFVTVTLLLYLYYFLKHSITFNNTLVCKPFILKMENTNEVIRVMVNNPFKESFYEKRKKKNN